MTTQDPIIEICKKIQDELTMLLASHHEIYQSPCKGVLLEELFCIASKSVGYHSDWKPNGSHQIGKDQSLGGIAISNKSGEHRKRKKDGKITLKITGSRTSKFKTLEDKLFFLSEKRYDYTICCARNHRDWNKNKKIYHLIALPHIDYTSEEFTWKPQLKDNGEEKDQQWKTDNNKNITAWIGAKTVSGQLFTEFSDKTFLYHKTINIDELLNN